MFFFALLFFVRFETLLRTILRANSEKYNFVQFFTVGF